MTFNLTLEAQHRLTERLGIIYGDAPISPFDWGCHAMDAFRWQSKNDKESPKFPVDGPRTKILEAE